MEPLVSIVIPCYNASATLGKTLDSACRQSWRHLEVIVVDDGSTDASDDLAEAYPDERVRVIRCENGGGCRARNIGICEAKGDYIQFLDADDLMEINKIALQVEALSDANDDRMIAYGPWWEFVDGDNSSIGPGYSAGRSFAEPMEWLFAEMKEGFYLPPHCWLVPSAVVEAAGEWDERLKQNQDGEYFSRVLSVASGVRWVRGASSYYRGGNDASVSKVKGRPYTESLLLAADLIRDRMLDYIGQDSSRRPVISALYLRILYRIDSSDKEMVARMWGEIEQLGFPSRSLSLGGTKFRMLKQLFGWKGAFRIKWLLQP